MEKFKSSVQYNDLSGTIAADKADLSGPSDFLKKKKLIKEDEHLIGVTMWAGENHGVHKDPVNVKFIVSKLYGHDNIPRMIATNDIKVRIVQFDMTVKDFFSLFKRISLTLSHDGILEGKEINEIE